MKSSSHSSDQIPADRVRVDVRGRAEALDEGTRFRLTIEVTSSDALTIVDVAGALLDGAHKAVMGLLTGAGVPEDVEAGASSSELPPPRANCSHGRTAGRRCEACDREDLQKPEPLAPAETLSSEAQSGRPPA